MFSTRGHESNASFQAINILFYANTLFGRAIISHTSLTTAFFMINWLDNRNRILYTYCCLSVHCIVHATEENEILEKQTKTTVELFDMISTKESNTISLDFL